MYSAWAMAKLGAPYLTCGLVTAASAAVSAGFSIHAVLHSDDVTAKYALARSIAIAIVALGLLRLRSREALLALAGVMGLVQAFDAVIGGLQHDLGKTIGPAFFAIAAFVTARWLFVEGQGERSAS
jgi:hypothetical protein